MCQVNTVLEGWEDSDRNRQLVFL